MIFIGGTGRSGTTILSKLLGNHSKCYVFPTEIRFITDPDGLLNLKHALVDNWSFFQGDIAIERFVRLINSLSTRYVGKYPNSNLKSIVGKEFYLEWLNQYVSQLYYFSDSNLWAARANIFRKGITRLFGINKFTSLFLEKGYFTSPLPEKDFFSLTKKFIEEFFIQASHLNKKKIAIEHTPSNLIHADFLSKVCPEFKLIHIYRDPLDVVCSFGSKDWGGNDVKNNFKWMQDIYSRWDLIKTKIPSDNYFEISFESLVQNPKNSVEKLCMFMNINFEENMLNLDLSRHNIGRWKDVLSSDKINFIEDNYKDILEKYRFNGNIN